MKEKYYVATIKGTAIQLERNFFSFNTAHNYMTDKHVVPYKNRMAKRIGRDSNRRAIMVEHKTIEGLYYDTVYTLINGEIFATKFKFHGQPNNCETNEFIVIMAEGKYYLFDANGNIIIETPNPNIIWGWLSYQKREIFCFGTLN